MKRKFKIGDKVVTTNKVKEYGYIEGMEAVIVHIDPERSSDLLPYLVDDGSKNAWWVAEAHLAFSSNWFYRFLFEGIA